VESANAAATAAPAANLMDMAAYSGAEPPAYKAAILPLRYDERTAPWRNGIRRGF
jgi:hypothetical protein